MQYKNDKSMQLLQNIANRNKLKVCKLKQTENCRVIGLLVFGKLRKL